MLGLGLAAVLLINTTLRSARGRKPLVQNLPQPPHGQVLYGAVNLRPVPVVQQPTLSCYWLINRRHPDNGRRGLPQS